jgi:hypothetical protein
MSSEDPRNWKASELVKDIADLHLDELAFPVAVVTDAFGRDVEAVAIPVGMFKTLMALTTEVLQPLESCKVPPEHWPPAVKAFYAEWTDELNSQVAFRKSKGRKPHG